MRRKKAAKKRVPGHRTRPAGRAQEPKWLRALRERTEPLSLALDEAGRIEFWKYSFDGPHDYNLMAWHPEGDLDFGFDEPTRRERFQLDTPTFKRLSYKTKRERLIEILESGGYMEILDGVVPWEDTEEGITKWLDTPAGDDFDDLPVSEWDSQYRPGNLIFDELTPAERKKYGIAQADFSSPGGDGPIATNVRCSVKQLNDLLRSKNLPFVVVADRR